MDSERSSACDKALLSLGATYHVCRPEDATCEMVPKDAENI